MTSLRVSVGVGRLEAVRGEGEVGGKGKVRGDGEVAKGVLPTVRNVQEAVVVLVLVVDGRHEGGGRGQHVVDEDKDRLLGAELDALPDHVHKLTDGEVSWDEIPGRGRERVRPGPGEVGRRRTEADGTKRNVALTSLQNDAPRGRPKTVRRRKTVPCRKCLSQI